VRSDPVPEERGSWAFAPGGAVAPVPAKGVGPGGDAGRPDGRPRRGASRGRRRRRPPRRLAPRPPV